MKIVGIIPARYQSTRLPGKPLIQINGKSMIQRVYQQATQSTSLAKVIVATDDDRIFTHVKEFNGEVMMTSPDHINGTERCGEVVDQLTEEFDIVLNIQGDEPFIHPEQIDQLADCFVDEKIEIATLIKAIDNKEDLVNPNILKVIINNGKEAIYFSRAPLPFYRGVKEEEWLANHQYYKHICFYGFRVNTLKKLVLLRPTPLETAESLEQLRWLEHGYTINTRITTLESPSIDTEEDLKKVTAK